MKSLFITLVGAVFLLPTVTHAKIAIFACEPEWAYIANAIGGKHVTAFSATTAKQNPHYISAKPSLMAKMRKADIVFCSGSGLEAGWLPVLLKSAGSSQVQVGNVGHVMASDHVQKLGVIHDASMIDRSMGDIHPEGNPHIHLDPRKYVQVAKAFAKVLTNIDAGNAVYYQKNVTVFVRNWQNHIARWEQQARPLRGKKIITHHKNYTYLADWLGLEVVATLEPKPGITPSIKHLSALVNNYKNANIHKIITAEYENAKAANWLSHKIHVHPVKLPYTSENDTVAMFDTIIEKLQ